LEFALAKVVAFLQCAEIGKAEVHRPFYFEDKRRGDEYPGDVRLNAINVARLMGIGRRRLEKRDEAFLIRLRASRFHA